MERERLSVESTQRNQNMLYSEHPPKYDRPPPGQSYQDDVSFGVSGSIFKNEYDSFGGPSSSMMSREGAGSSAGGAGGPRSRGSRERGGGSGDPGRYSSQSRSLVTGGSHMSNPDANLSRQIASEYAALEAPTMQPVAEHIRISKKHYEVAKSTDMQRSHRAANQSVVLKKPLQGNVMSASELGEQTIAATSSISSPMHLTTQRHLNAPLANATSFFMPPDEPAGRVVDLSDRLHICMSSNCRNEVVVGCSDHALYSVDVSNDKKRPITMYSKKYGHTDWVTGVTHLANGNVVSASMDGKLCLWDTSRRRCVDVFGHEGSITKVISDQNTNFAMSLGYDGNLLAWNFNQSSTFNPNAVYAPVCTFMGHQAPILECAYHNGSSSCGGSVIATGAKNGGLYLWDVTTGAVISRYKAHKTPITSLEWVQGTGLFMTGGADGFVKVWDPREKNVVQRIPVHTSDGTGGSNGGGFDTSMGPPPRSYAAAVACLACLAGEGGEGGVGGGGLGYVVSGGSESAIKILDVRGGSGSFSVVESYEHHNNGIYSLCAVGSRGVISGDGVGMLLVYDIYESGNGALKYGLGTSGSGAVRAVTVMDGKVVSACEDGNVVIHSF